MIFRRIDCNKFNDGYVDCEMFENFIFALPTPTVFMPRTCHMPHATWRRLICTLEESICAAIIQFDLFTCLVDWLVGYLIRFAIKSNHFNFSTVRFESRWTPSIGTFACKYVRIFLFRIQFLIPESGLQNTSNLSEKISNPVVG